MVNPLSLMTGDITKKLLIGGAVAVGVILLIKANNQPARPNNSSKSLDGVGHRGGKKSGKVIL